MQALTQLHVQNQLFNFFGRGDYENAKCMLGLICIFFNAFLCDVLLTEWEQCAIVHTRSLEGALQRWTDILLSLKKNCKRDSKYQIILDEERTIIQYCILRRRKKRDYLFGKPELRTFFMSLENTRKMCMWKFFFFQKWSFPFYQQMNRSHGEAVTFSGDSILTSYFIPITVAGMREGLKLKMAACWVRSV